ncbi:hypothetical protein O3M35_010725 [Rhynocoris fuscipes]|uniref:Ribonuclease H2 subunit B n=1 Tax=Rhynocoris fuscipes TaxID=488301 RepID=A0AAW1D2T1_9HEMI
MKKQTVKSSKKNPRSFVFLIKDDIISNEVKSDVLNLIKLRHPKTGDGAYFAINGKVHEILKFSDEKRSYFIDDNVASDGDLYLSTPVDPLFLILSYLIKAKRCCPLDQVLIDEEYPDIEKLLSCININQLYHIADRKGDEELNAFIYNEEKTLIWLRKKLNRIAALLKDKGIHVSSNKAVSANFVKTESHEDPQDSYLRYALGLLAEYLLPELVTKLADFIGLPPEEKKSSLQDENESPNDKRRRNSSVEDDEDNKKIKLEESYESLPSTPTVKTEKKQSAKEQAMAKAAKGSKSISSFFKKK